MAQRLNRAILADSERFVNEILHIVSLEQLRFARCISEIIYQIATAAKVAFGL